MRKLTKAKKRKLKQFFFIVVMGLLSALCIALAVFWIAKAMQKQEEPETEGFVFSDYEIEKPKTKKMLLTKNVNSRPGISLEQVNGIVIHYTANPGTDAVANRNYFESRKDCPDQAENKVSSHYIIGLKGNIIQCIPEDEIAYASNDRNSDTISIECCHPDTTGEFTEKTYRSLLALTAYLCVKYEIQKEDIIRHYDVTGKNCPKYYVEHPDAWNQLRDDVFALIIS
ncbi:MAG: N-acetylmuramoyl-L-alanine amidase [Clostridiaceae bacterium]|nr:N-acetylmuramoyl-L-alanine amidase [Clostridiaceae bacterium]